MKKYVTKKDFCNVFMPFEDTKISEFNQYQRSGKAPFIIYADLECVIEKIDRCTEKLIYNKESEHISYIILNKSKYSTTSTLWQHKHSTFLPIAPHLPDLYHSVTL